MPFSKPLSPEEKFLLECVFDPKDSVCAGLDYAAINPSEIVRKCIDLKMMGFLWARLHTLGMQLSHFKITDAVQKLENTIVTRNQRLLREAGEITQRMNERGIPFVFIKGLATCYYAYNTALTVRAFGDFDILVSPEDAPAAYETLQRELHYKVKDNEDRQEIYKKTVQHYSELHRDDFSIDLHFRLTQSIEPFAIPVDAILRDRKEVLLHGVCIPVPNEAWNFAILCHHMWRHQVLEFSYQPRQCAEICALLNRYKKEDGHWQSLHELSQNAGIHIPILYTLHHLNTTSLALFDTELVTDDHLALFTPPDFHDIHCLHYRKLLTYDSFGSWPDTISYAKRLLRIPHDTNPDVYNLICRLYMCHSIENAWRSFCHAEGIAYVAEIVPGKSLGE